VNDDPTIYDKDRAVVDRRELEIARRIDAGQSRTEAEAAVPKITFDALDVSFDAIEDPVEQREFMEMPPTFFLPPQSIDRLRELGGRILRRLASLPDSVPAHCGAREARHAGVRETNGGLSTASAFRERRATRPRLAWQWSTRQRRTCGLVCRKWGTRFEESSRFSCGSSCCYPR
jgi:hypothetical protein